MGETIVRGSCAWGDEAGPLEVSHIDLRTFKAERGRRARERQGRAMQRATQGYGSMSRTLPHFRMAGTI